MEMTNHTLVQTIYTSLNNYPTLYDYGNWRDSILAVLNHVFIVNGSGYYWVDGARQCYRYDDEKPFNFDKPILKGIARDFYVPHLEPMYPAPYPQPYKLKVPDDIKEDWAIAYIYVLDWSASFFGKPYPHHKDIDYNPEFKKIINNTMDECVLKAPGHLNLIHELRYFIDNIKSGG